MKSQPPAPAASIPDIVGIGYPALRTTFNKVLADCEKHLTKTEMNEALAQLGVEDVYDGELEFLTDMALYARADSGRRQQHRAIDRIAKKLPQKRDPLVAFIAQALPSATFSLFEFIGTDSQDYVELRDLLDKRLLKVKDNGLAVSGRAGLLFAGRFIELPPWHVGFGIIITLKKSEALALTMMASMGEDLTESREALQQLIYASHIHGMDLVRAALDPLIDVLAEQIDASPSDISTLAALFRQTIPPET